MEANADCNERILRKMLANRNELKSVGREEMKLVNAEGLFSRVFLLRRTKEMGRKAGTLCAIVCVWWSRYVTIKASFHSVRCLQQWALDLLKERGT